MFQRRYSAKPFSAMLTGIAAAVLLTACGGGEEADLLATGAATSGEEAQARRSSKTLDTTPPTVSIGSTSAIDSAGGVNLAGTASDNASVRSVAWTNSRGGSGTAALTGTATSVSWTAASVPLQIGDNTITITAKDGSGNATSTTTVVSRADSSSGEPPVSTYPMAPALSLAALTGALVAYDMPWNDTKASPISPSFRNPKPAGAMGPISVVNGRLSVGGSRIRLYGINMSLGALTPTHAEADAIAANLAKQGFNAVRIHGFDRPYIGRTYKQQGILNPDWKTFNPTALDLFDYLVAKLIENGIYIKFMTHSDRIYPESPDCLGFCEAIDNYMPALIQSQKDFLASFLNHVNPYTGRSYASEPAIFAVETNNENTLTQRWLNGTIDKYIVDPVLAPKYIAPLKSLWNNWLTAKYGNAAALAGAWGQPIASISDVAVPLRASLSTLGAALLGDWWRFVAATEESYWNQMYDYTKVTLGFKGLVSGGQMSYSPTFFKPKSDFTDVHYYFHPLPSIAGTYSSPGAPNDGYPIYATTSNVPQYFELDPKNSFYGSMNRLKGKPHIVSEYSQRSNNLYVGDAEMMMFSYALFQDWDGVFLFTYSDQNLIAPEKKQGFLYNDALKKIARTAAVTMFKRGDVSPGATEKVYAISKESTFKRLAAGASYENQFAVGANIREGFRSRISHTIVDTIAQEIVPASSTFSGTDYVTDNNQITWSAGSSFSINTPKTQMRTSVPDGQTTALGSGVSVEVGKTMLGRATMTLTSLNDAENLPSASSMLFTITGANQAENAWMSADALQHVIGIGKNRLEAVPARVTIPKSSGKTLRVFALDDTGNIKLEVPVTDGGASWSFVVGPGTDSPMYLMQQK